MKKTWSFLFIAVLFAAMFTSCDDEADPVLPTAGFTFTPAEIVVYDVVTFTNTTVEGVTYAWSFGDGSLSTDENPTHTYTTAGTYTVTLVATNADGVNEISETITVNAPDNHYMLGTDKLAITTEIFWYQSSMGGDPYLRLLTTVDGQDNPDLLKLYPNKGLGELPGTYTWDNDTQPVGTYNYGYTANYAGMAYDWTAISKTGSSDLVFEEVETDVYRVTGTLILSVGSYDWSTGVFTETSEKTLTISYIGAITPLGK